MAISIRPLAKDDKAVWLTLWDGYLQYYRTELDDGITQTTWDKIMDGASGVHGIGAIDNKGDMIGFAHYLFHPVTWSNGPRCYLEDLFTAESGRGKGAGAALIKAVAQDARDNNADQLYWLTESFNERAQALYDKVATKTHFIKYMKRL